MAHLSIHLLGTFNVSLDEHPVTNFDSNKVRGLLAYLAVESDRPHTRETLSALFWPDDPQEAALSSLRNALSNLRRVIGDRDASTKFLNITRTAIQFNQASDAWVDVAQFEKSTTSRRQMDIQEMAAGIALYHDTFLKGLSIPDSDLFEEWARVQRERLGQQALQALRRMADWYESCGDYPSALAYAQRLVALEPWSEEGHQQIMRILALSGQRSEALAQFSTCRDILARELGVEPGKEIVRLYETIQSGRLEEIHTDEPLPVPGKPPYKGLQYFEESDSDLFFGRESLTAFLNKRITEMVKEEPSLLLEYEGGIHLPLPLLAVVGGSGSGKSSLVRAGLVPELKRNGFEVQVFTPSAQPLKKIEGLWTSQISPKPGQAPVVIVVDQFEELFTLCGEEEDRAAFIEKLLRPPPETTRSVVVLVLRADYYGHCAQYPYLRHALSSRQVYIGPMTEADLRRAIEEPVRSNGWVFDPGLVDLILEDIGAKTSRSSNPGALPLLEHALLETWKRRRGRTMTLKGYTEAGGVRSAIAKTAESLYENLDQNRQRITRLIFLRLVELGEGIHVSHRRLGLNDLIPAGDDRKATIDIVHRLATARLLVLEWNSAIGQEEVELAHEALILHWPRLQDWLEETRADLYLVERVRDASLEWQAAGRPAGLLVHTGSRLENALHGYMDGRLSFNQVELDYLLACQEQREAERIARERRRSGIIIIAMSVTVVMALIAFWGIVQASIARRNAEISLGQQLSAQAREMIGRPLFGETAVLLAVESLRHSPSTSGNETLADSLNLLPITIAQMQHDGSISMVAFSPDGKHVAASSLDGAVLVWEAETGKETARMRHDGQVGSILFSPDGRRLVTGSQDRTVRVWDPATGREMLRLDHSGAVWSVAYSLDGKWIATGSQDGFARVWNARTGEEQSAVEHDGNVYSVDFSPDGTRVISGGQDGFALVWLAAVGQVRLRLYHGSEIWAVDYSPNGKTVGTGGWDGVARVWDVDTGSELARMRHTLDVRSIAFSPDGVHVISGSYDGTARVWEIENGREVSRFLSQGRVLLAGFSPDGRLAVSTGEDGAVHLWDARNGSEVSRVHHKQPVPSVAFSSNGRTVVSGGRDGVVKVWQAESGRETARMQHDGGVSLAAFSPDGTLVLSASDDGTARVWEKTTGKEVSRMLHGGRVLSAAFSADGTLIISGSEDRTTRIWRTDTGREVARIANDDTVSSVAFSPDGRYAACSSRDGVINIWEYGTGVVMLQILGQKQVLSIAFTPDGKQLVSTDRDGTRYFWQLAAPNMVTRIQHDKKVQSVAYNFQSKMAVFGYGDGEIEVIQSDNGAVRVEMNHGGPVPAIAASQDGKWIISGSQDGSMRVWDAENGTEIARFRHAQPILSVGFRPDGREIVFGSQDGTVRIWLWRSEDIIARACSRLSRNLTLEEWNLYLGELPYRVTCPNLPAGT